MSVLGDVLDSLNSMSMLQLLAAFLACIGYAFAQGGLPGPRGRNVACAVAVMGAAGFAVESAEWMHAAVLLAAAVAGLGVFVAVVWITSSMLGFGRSGLQLSRDTAPAEAAPEPGPAQAQSARSSERAHAI